MRLNVETPTTVAVGLIHSGQPMPKMHEQTAVYSATIGNLAPSTANVAIIRHAKSC